MKIVFDIEHPGESAAGISSYSDTVILEVESGYPGGQDGEFTHFIQDALAEWFDGARVVERTKIEDAPAFGQGSYADHGKVSSI